MPTISDNALCIRRWDYSETSQTVSFFTREHGVLRGIAKGAKREKGSFSGGIDLLTRGRVMAITKTGRELATLTQWDLEEIFPALRTSLACNRAGVYIADLLHHFMTDAGPEPALFDATVTSLQSLQMSADARRVLVDWPWRLLCAAGYRPELDHDAETGASLNPGDETFGFSAQAGGLVADTGTGDRWRVRSETIQLLRAMRSRGDVVLHEVPDITLQRAGRLLAAYIRSILGYETSAMRWTFPDVPA